MSEELLTPKLEWPLLSPSLEEAIDFIRTSVGDATSVSGPKAIFASYTDAPDIRSLLGVGCRPEPCSGGVGTSNRRARIDDPFELVYREDCR